MIIFDKLVLSNMNHMIHYNYRHALFESSQHPIFVSIVSFLVFGLLEWAMHLLAHNRKWGGEMYRIHIAHHHAYHQNRLLQSAPYMGEGGEKVFLPPVLAIWMLAYCIFEIQTSVIFIIESSILLVVSNYLHEEFHIKDSCLEHNAITRDWFIHRRRLHFMHHHNPTMNMSLGGINHVADRMFGTYMEVPNE